MKETDSETDEDWPDVEPRDKAEGWYMLHDMRRVNWDEWKKLDNRTQEDIIEEVVDYFENSRDVDEGGSAMFSVLGNKADLMFLHVRPTLEELDSIERKFESTRLSNFTEESSSHLSVAEVGGYTNEDVENDELSDYAESKLFPEIPDKKYISFYPMDRKRGEQNNWYTLSKDERDELMTEHRKTGMDYAGKVKQIISGSIGMDDWEWGVDLFTDDMLHAKHIVYEMRFDVASSRYSEFGPFYTGIRFEPEDLTEYMEGESVPSEESDSGSGTEEDGTEEGDIREELDELGVYAGKPHGEDVYALVLYSEADEDELVEEVEGLASNFDHYGTHVKTAVYRNEDGEKSAIVSIWDTQSAADTASGYLSDLPGIVERAGEENSKFGTMGMFYTVKPDYRDDFVEKFDEVGEMLNEMDGHLNTDLMINTDNENDMFIASQWEDKDSAMEFFRGDAFRDTVDWGRKVLDDRPRHVFLA